MALSFPSNPNTNDTYTENNITYTWDGEKWVVTSSASFQMSGADIKVAYEGEADTNAFTDSDETKLDGIEAAATADQTGAEIKAAYEAEADTNAFTDAEQSKLLSVELNATADQTGAEIKALYEAEADTNAFTDADHTKLDGIEDSATADQTGAEIKAAYEAEADTNAFTDAQVTKLAGIEDSATADQTGAEIKALYEAEADTNAFTDALLTKLNGIEEAATADQTKADIDALGIDADTLDSIQASSFVRSDADDTFTGSITGNTLILGGSEIQSSSASLQVNGFVRTGNINLHEGGNTPTATSLVLSNNAGSLEWNSNTVWHAGNDGAFSGLDADNLDGFTWTSTGKNLRGDDIYSDNWFRNVTAGEGLVNDSTAMQWYSSVNDAWTLKSVTAGAAIQFRTANDSLRGFVYADTAPSIGFLNTGGQWGLRYLSNDGNSPNLYFKEEANETWTGNPGNDEGKIEYHSNRFYIAAGANSTEIVKFRRSSADRGTIDNSGNLTMSGNVTAFSDITLKKNIEVIPNALDKVSNIRGVTYDRIDDEDLPRQAGVIAQEVEVVLPEVVNTDENGIKSVAYGNMVGLLIEAVKELKKEVETLKKERN